MAHKTLSEKLDQVSSQELGFEFDESAVWSRLEQRLDNRKPYVIWWAASACLVLGLAFILNISFDHSEKQILSDQSIETSSDNDIQTPAIVDEHANPSVAEDEVVQFQTPELLKRKGIDPLQMASLPAMKLSLEPIVIPVKKENKKSLFAAEDISTIQASLEQSNVENGRTMTIRAQWQKSPDELNVNYQALKIKLYEKDKNQ